MANDWVENFLHCGAVLGLSQDRALVAWGSLASRSWNTASHPPEDLSGPVFYNPDFFQCTASPWLTPEGWTWITFQELLAALEPFARKPALPPWTPPNPTDFRQSFDELQKLFQNGHLKKGVPFVTETCPWNPRADELAYLLCQAIRYASSLPVHLYGFWERDQGLLGVSPEILFSLDRPARELKTVAFAGTRRATDPNPVSLLDDPKERLEHQWVIDGIQTSLAPFGKIQTGTTHVVALPHLSHLKTEITLALGAGNEDWGKLVRALHPTPALGAFPKAAGDAWLRSQDRREGVLPRDRFGAPFGAFWKEAGLCIVSIRNLRWDEHRLKISAGCGVISDSRHEREWQELQGKIGAIKNIFGLGEARA